MQMLGKEIYEYYIAVIGGKHQALSYIYIYVVFFRLMLCCRAQEKKRMWMVPTRRRRRNVKSWKARQAEEYVLLEDLA